MPTATMKKIELVAPERMAEIIGTGVYNEAYSRGLNLSQYLEHTDPTHKRAEGERGLDAFERLMKAARIVAVPNPERGIHATTWEDATDTQQKRAIMLEWAARVYRNSGAINAQLSPDQRAILLSGDAALNTIANAYTDDRTIRAKRLVAPIPLNAIIAREVGITNDAYRSIYITDDLNTDAYRMKRVAEGADIPTTTLVTGEHILRINKFGRALRATYEQLRRETIDRVAFLIQRMALQAEVDKVSDALNVLINGDGNANTAATVLTLTSLDPAAVAGTLTLKGWLTFKARFTNAYTMNTLLAQEASIIQLLLLPIPVLTGQPLAMIPPGVFGSIRPISDVFNGTVRYGITADAPALKLVGFDANLALEMVNEIGSQISEVERYIVNQTQLFTLTESVGFGVLDPYASRILNINA